MKYQVWKRMKSSWANLGQHRDDTVHCFRNSSQTLLVYHILHARHPTQICRVAVRRICVCTYTYYINMNGCGCNRVLNYHTSTISTKRNCNSQSSCAKFGNHYMYQFILYYSGNVSLVIMHVLLTLACYRHLGTCRSELLILQLSYVLLVILFLEVLKVNIFTYV